ncbi:MAG TPA: hypothetical protein VKA12_08925 [Roseiarcus sp.]|nr:hypothetical protein [Roseiarcus sp.]
MSVLDRPPAPDEPSQNSRSIGEETKPEQAGRVEELLDDCVESAERNTPIERGGGGSRSSVRVR